MTDTALHNSVGTYYKGNPLAYIFDNTCTFYDGLASVCLHTHQLLQ